MKIDLKTCTEEELWKYVAVHLKKNGIDTILVGGAVVAIYTKGLYRSGDLDFVLASMFTEGLEEAMNEIGFKKFDARRYAHPECKHLLVEFPGGPPLGIGEDYSIKPQEVKIGKTIIKIFSPTDCVKDRLASYIYFKSMEGLNQAVLVAKAQNINLASIKKWCKGENALWAFEDLVERLKSGNAKNDQ